MNLDLAALIRRYCDGDIEAADTLARRAGNTALRTAAAACGDRDLAADIAQDVAVEVLQHLGDLRDPDRFDAWVHRIAVRRTMAVLSRRSRRLQRERPLDSLSETDEPGVFDPQVDATAIERRDAVQAAMLALPPRHRIALTLRYVHDMTEPEIADALGCRPGTAGSLLSRGRAMLRADARLTALDDSVAAGGPR